MRQLPTVACIFFVLASLIFIGAAAQDTTNRGKEFWVGYGHHHSMEVGDNSQEMYLYISTGSQPATVILTIDSSSLSTNPATWWRRTYTIPPDTVVSIDNYPATSFTSSAGLKGPIPKGENGKYDVRLYSASGSVGLFRKKGIHIESNVAIGVQSHIAGSVCSGASMLLPVEAWGYSYIALSNKQAYSGINAFSWLYIIAKEDNTIVELTPSVLTKLQNLTGLRQGVPTTITLQKGQIYQVGAALHGADTSGNGTNASTGFDLTGTRVKAVSVGKPIAVFVGSTRTYGEVLCGGIIGSGTGADNEMVQLFPIHTWGKKYLTAPTSAGSKASIRATNIYKILVYDTTTIVKRNGIILDSLLDRRYYRFESNMPEYIEADKAVMVGQFIATGPCNFDDVGDPEMTYLSPINAGLNSANGKRATNSFIKVQYLSVILPTGGLASLRINDSVAFDTTYFHPQLNGYSVVVKRWIGSDGMYNIKCDSAFTGMAYGLGPVESYAFNIGAKFNPFNGIDPNFRVVWLGAVSNDWKNGENWSIGVPPTGDDHVFIKSSTPFSLVIPDGIDANCKSLELETGAIITVSPAARLNVGK